MSSPTPLITRFAPAPTGYLHMGHLLSAAYVWGIGRFLGAKILLRIEDHDSQRSRIEYEEALLEDLDWFGLRSDNWAEVTSSSSTPFKQRHRRERYEELLATLPTYACDCSRSQLKKRSPVESGKELRYDGYCRDRGNELSDQLGIRWRMESEAIHFEDGRHGPTTQLPADQCGDLLLRDRNGNYTYHFAVVVDDLDQGVNLIVRGDDLFDSTGRQLALHQALGNENNIRWIHHPLVTDEDGEKLSKARRSESLRERRAQGVSPQQLLGEALTAANVLPAFRAVEVEELPQLFAQQL